MPLMLRIVAVCLLLGATPAFAEGPTLQSARQRWLRGNYEEARAQFETLTKDPKQRVAATVGLSRAWQSQGDYDKALAVLDQAIKELPPSADLLARRGEVLHLRGRWDEADQAATAALALTPDHFLAQWVH